MTTPLKIIIDEGTRPIIESIEVKNTSLFAELYDKTFSCIENYLSSVGSNTKDGKGIKTDYPNNIIAFLGERGSGKTSCMLSVAEMLQKKKSGEQDFPGYKSLSDTTFLGVDVIEPSFIGEDANVLELVVAALFKNFKAKVENDTNNINLDSKHELLESFQKVQKDLKFVNKGAADLDTIDSLLQLSSGVDLKEHLKSLIDCYLKFNSRGIQKEKQNILLLTIDDIDLNTQFAYTMVEQIRKYLILPNVLILLSLKIDQLEQVLCNNFIKQFESSLKNHGEHLLGDIQQMSERYIQKLIPLEHRIFMPDMEAAMDKPYLVYKDAQQAQENYEKDSRSYEKDESKVLKHQILAAIFQKTRFLFYNTKGKASYIIPRNLREFRNLVALLHNLPDYKGDNYGNCYNKTIFKKYFYETWCENNLSSEKNVLFTQITSVQDAVNTNATVLLVMRKLLKNLNLYNDLIAADDYKYIFSENNYKWNISLGDVMAVLNYYEGHTASLDDLKLVFAIKTHYSMKLYEYYDELTASNPVMSLVDVNATGDNKNAGEQINKTKQITRKDKLFGHSNYAKLVGGSYIHSDIVKLLPGRGSALTSRSQRMIDYSLLSEKIKNVNEKLKDLPDKRSNLTENEMKTLKRDIPFIEFFLLLSVRKPDRKSATTSTKYREDSDVWYSANLSGAQKNIWFDVTSCLYNCLDIESTYKRISVDFYNSLEKFDKLVKNPEDKSLYSKITKKCIEERKKKEPMHSCYSMLAIRNIEILDDMLYELSTKRNDGGNEEKVYGKFFNALASYRMSTYDIDAEDHYLQISFSALSAIYKFLYTMSPEEKSEFDQVFSNKIEISDISWMDNFPRGGMDSNSIIEKFKEKYVDYPKLNELAKKLKDNLAEDKYKRPILGNILKKIQSELES